MRGKWTCLLILFWLLIPVQGYSTSITINFDEIKSGSKINSYYSTDGIIFQGFHKSGDIYTSSDVYAMSSTINSDETNLITASKKTLFLNAYYIVAANFDLPVKSVSIKAYPSKPYSTSWAWMKAFDFKITNYSTKLKPLYTVQTESTSGKEETLTITSDEYNIRSVVFMGKARRHVYFDDLSFETMDKSNPVPEPATATLIISTIFFYPFIRKKQPPKRW